MAASDAASPRTCAAEEPRAVLPNKGPLGVSITLPRWESVEGSKPASRSTSARRLVIILRRWRMVKVVVDDEKSERARRHTSCALTASSDDPSFTPSSPLLTFQRCSIAHVSRDFSGTALLAIATRGHGLIHTWDTTDFISYMLTTMTTDSEGAIPTGLQEIDCGPLPSIPEDDFAFPRSGGESPIFPCSATGAELQPGRRGSAPSAGPRICRTIIDSFYDISYDSYRPPGVCSLAGPPLIKRGTRARQIAGPFGVEVDARNIAPEPGSQPQSHSAPSVVVESDAAQ